MKITLSFIVLLFAAQLLFGQSRTDLIGKDFSKLSEIKTLGGFKEQEGVVWGADDSYGISRIAKGKETILIFEKFVARSPVRYKIIDAIAIGNVDQSHQAVIILGTCRVKKHADKAVVAVVTKEDTQYFKHVIKAWRIINGKFKPIPTSNIDCFNEEFGYDG